MNEEHTQPRSNFYKDGPFTYRGDQTHAPEVYDWADPRRFVPPRG